MVQKKKPARMCVGCQELHDKNEMIRIVRSPEGQFSVDRTGKKAGRGAYLCAKKECFEQAVAGHRLERSFKGAIDAQIYEELRQELFPDEC